MKRLNENKAVEFNNHDPHPHHHLITTPYHHPHPYPPSGDQDTGGDEVVIGGGDA
jgi:hypothetical protein